jgi:hypothetical protein
LQGAPAGGSSGIDEFQKGHQSSFVAAFASVASTPDNTMRTTRCGGVVSVLSYTMEPYGFEIKFVKIDFDASCTLQKVALSKVLQIFDRFSNLSACWPVHDLHVEPFKLLRTLP